MKKLIFSFIFVTLNFIIIFAQNKDYKIVEKDGKIYYNKNLPVYFWITTSPNDNSDDVLLTSHSTKAYANPMYFDTQGYNTIQTNYASNSPNGKSGHQEYKIYADSYPPILNVYFKGTRKYISGAFYYNKKLKIVMQAKDYISGVEKIEYSINGSEYMEYSEPLTFEKEGKYKLECFAIDYVGNKSNISTYNFNIKY